MEPTPFVPFADRVALDDAIADLHRRLDATRWPEAEPVDDDSQGLPLEVARRLADRWRHGWSVDRFVDRVGSLPQVRLPLTPPDGAETLDVHALHVRSPRADAVPLLLTHGWPSTPYEFVDLVPLLTDPAADRPAFHVVCPSLPGYGFSGKPTVPGWGLARIADTWVELMTALGYDRYAVAGGDWGAMVSTELAVRHPDRVRGLHLTMPVARVRDGDLDEAAGASQAERDGAELAARFRRRGSGYAQIQSTRPQTMGYGLVDSPVAQLTWIVEQLLAWSAEPMPDDTMLDVVTLYWLGATGASSARLYAESFRTPPDAEVTVPTGCAIFPAEPIRTPRAAVARRYTDLREWREMPRGGHFAAIEEPAALAEALGDFVRGLP